MWIARKQHTADNIERLSILRLAQHGDKKSYEKQLDDWERKL